MPDNMAIPEEAKRLAAEKRKEKSKGPPTQRQLDRVDELIEHPAITPHLNSLLLRMDANIKTQGGTGVLINWLKGEIKKWERDHDFHVNL